MAHAAAAPAAVTPVGRTPQAEPAVDAKEPSVSKPPAPPSHPAAYPVMSVPVNDPLWRRPALLASALAGLLVGLAAYGVRWTREQVQAYEPSVATAAAVAEPQTEVAGASSFAEPTPPEPVKEMPVADAAPTEAASDSAPSSKETSKRAPRAKGTSRPRPVRAQESAPSVPVTVTGEASSKAESDVPVPQPATPSQSSAETPPVGESLAKSQPVGAAEPAMPFDRDAAVAALATAAQSAERCRSEEGPFGSVRIAVTFAPNGRATTAVVEGPPFAGTPVGSCIARAFREARVSPFSGPPVTVRKSVTIF